MKIAILTFTDGTNIGQRLQNYALQTVLMQSGHEVWTLKQQYSSNALKLKTKYLLVNFKHPEKMLSAARRLHRFRSFNRKYIRFYEKKISFSKDNRSINKEFDFFVAGSDQIWNPNSPFVGDNFFLTFADRSKRSTYAPSFSVEKISENKQELYRNRLNGFDNISIREYKGADIVKQLTGKNATVVLDPTLLLNQNDWDVIRQECREKPTTKYILSMFLGEFPESDVQQINHLTKIPLFTLNEVSAISPSEFIDLISDAELVLTDSYHVTIFSILYHVPFVNFNRKGTAINMNSRFHTLYQLLGIPDRYWRNETDFIDELFSMDFTEIEINRTIERRKSIEILNSSISNKS